MAKASVFSALAHPLAGADRAEYLIVHGSYLLCYADVTLKWRIGGAGKLQGLDPIHPDRLADQHAAELLAEQVSMYHFVGLGTCV